MNTAEFIKMAFPKLIEATGDPLAPIKLQEAFKHAAVVGRMLAGSAEKSRTIRYGDDLVRLIQGADHTPEMLMALASTFCSAIQSYIAKTTKE